MHRKIDDEHHRQLASRCERGKREPVPQCPFEVYNEVFEQACRSRVTLDVGTRANTKDVYRPTKHVGLVKVCVLSERHTTETGRTYSATKCC